MKLSIVSRPAEVRAAAAAAVVAAPEAEAAALAGREVVASEAG